MRMSTIFQAILPLCDVNVVESAGRRRVLDFAKLYAVLTGDVTFQNALFADTRLDAQ